MSKFLQIFRALLVVVTCLTTQAQAQIISTIVGTGTPGFTGDNGPATAAEIDLAQGTVRFYAGNLYITDQLNQRIRVINPFTGIITTMAGNGTPGWLGDGGPATAAEIHDAVFMDFDQAGDMYFTEFTNCTVRKITPSGIISTIAGEGPYYPGYSGDGVPATASELQNPTGIAVNNSTGDIYVCDDNNNRIRMIDIYGNISTIAGTGIAGYSGDGGAAATAQIYNPVGLCIDGSGNLYFSDAANARIREINTSGIITTIAGTGAAGDTGDGGPATNALLHNVGGIGLDASHNLLYLAQTIDDVIRCVNLSTGIITRVAGIDDSSGYSGDSGPATVAKLFTPFGVDADCSGNIYIADYNNHRVRYVNYYYNHDPTFASGSSAGFSACATVATSINSLLGISDTDAGQDEWWVIYAGPSHGTLGGFVATATAPTALGVVTPTGLTYTSAGGYTGTDSFKVGVADCAGGTAVITLYVTVNPLPATITGTLSVCTGLTTTLSDGTGGGVWSAGSPSVATIGSGTGVVTGVGSGTSVVAYTLPTGCFVTANVTDNPLPAGITGTTVICAGSTTTLSDAPGGGRWSSGNTSIATVGSVSGIVTGVATGTVTITYTLAIGCTATTTVTVNASVPAITGTMSVCNGATTTLSDGTGGGSWSSSNTSIAMVGSSTGTVMGTADGTATITYTLSTGCFATAVITVNPAPAAITGTMEVCVGLTATLGDGTGGGTWSSGNISIATVGSVSSVVTGVTTGTATITYTLSDGCRATTLITVNPLPAAITGSTSVCTGSTATLSDGTSGGVWSSATSGIATIGSSSGVMTGVGTGIGSVIYLLPTGCYTTAMVTVNPLPDAISGSAALCVGSTTTLTDGSGGGTWSSSNTSVAIIGSSSGLLSGVATGTTVINYTLGTGCSSSITVTINSLPPSITGNTPVCIGYTLTLGDPDAGGVWSSSNTSVATVGSGSGIVTGVASGTATLSYTLGTGCIATSVVTVNSTPASVSGTAAICIGSTSSLSDATGGGTWSSGNTSVATIGSTGLVTSVAAGTATISYSVSTGCFAALTVTVAPFPVTGTMYVCVGETTTLSDATSGGTWSSGSTSVATVGSSSGVVTGVAAGTATITYTTGSGCTITAVVTVNAAPAAITGQDFICPGGKVTLNDATGGGTWSSNNTSIATVGSASGTVTGVSLGTTTITYSDGGCYVTSTFTVVAMPAAISGTTLFCDGTSTALSVTGSGGIWTSSNTSIAFAGSSTGIVTGITAGTATITYSIGTGCLVTTSVTVEPLPATIAGSAYICDGATTTFTDTTSGGVWVSGSPSIASIGSASGSVTGLSGGTALISYVLPTGCLVTKTLSVIVVPPIMGANNMCAWVDTESISDADTSGAFTSTLATVTNLGGGDGLLTAVAPGTSIVVYTLRTYGCAIATTVTINPLPGVIFGTMAICSGATTTLYNDTTGGIWTSGSTGIATIGSLSGTVTGVSAGRTEITYTLPTGCYVDTPVVVQTPTAIGGVGMLCVGGSMTLADGVTGGSWATSNPAIAIVNATTGKVTGIAPGVDTISYTACATTVTTVITVSAAPPISGASILCVTGSTTLSDTDAGGTWSSSNTGVATIGTTGTVTAVGLGGATIFYTLSVGCVATHPVTVADTGACVPCSVLTGGYSALGLSGVISSNVSRGNYYISNNVTIVGNDTFDNAIVVIAPGDTIFVDSTGFLVSDSSHFFSPCQEWAGMALMPGVAHSGRVAVREHSLIEDAMCAIYAPSPVTPASGDVIYCDASVFNRNVVGVFIKNYDPAINSYPFHLSNTVITSRELYGFTGYPSAWPATTGTRGLKDYWSGADAFTGPYGINNPALGYAGISCKGGIIPTYAIDLDSVGSYYTTSPPTAGVPIPAQYYELMIGDTAVTDSNQNMNLFDNYNYGVFAVNSNVTCVNNAFTNMFAVIPEYNIGSGTSTSPGGDGIYAVETNDIVNKNRLRVYTPPGSVYKNWFYDFNYGAQVSNYFQVVGLNNYMINKSYGTSFTPAAGSAGWYVKTAKYDTINISNDTISNVLDGIAVWMAFDPTYMLSGTGGTITEIPSQYMGLCNLDNNLVQAHPSWTATLTTQQVGLAISYQNPTMSWPVYDAVEYAYSLSISNNTIHDAYDGIYVDHYWAPRGYNPLTMGNTIYLRQNATGTVRRLAYGINHTNSQRSEIFYNTVQGTVSGASANDSMRAIYAESNSLADVGCNTEFQIGRGFEFIFPNAGMQWHANSMQDNDKGMVLNGSIIGPQPSSGYIAMNNSWQGTWSVASSAQTYVYHGANAALSPFLVNSGTITDPINNQGTFGPWDYAAGTSILTTPVTDYPPCMPYYGAPISDTGNLLNLIAEQHVAYTYNVMPSNWMGQYALWKSIVMDSTIVDSSAVIAEFATLANTMSRYKYLTSIEYALSTGDLTTANSLLGLNIDSMADTTLDTLSQVYMADGTGADYIVQNYQRFYGLYIKYETGTMASADSLGIVALAQMCPEINGAVVFQARALYSDIFNDLSVFSDDSCLDVDSTYIAERHGPTVQQTNDSISQRYSLFPNPNDGSFILQQATPDAQPVKAEIWNALGMSIYADDLYFNSGTDKLSVMNAAPGLYLLRLTDSKNRQFTLKFAVE